MNQIGQNPEDLIDRGKEYHIKKLKELNKKRKEIKKEMKEHKQTIREKTDKETSGDSLISLPTPTLDPIKNLNSKLKKWLAGKVLPDE